MISISFHRTRAAALALGALIAAQLPATATAQQISACYTNKNGTMYRVGTTNTPSTCTNPSHTLETWGAKLDANAVLNLTNANGLVAGGTIGTGAIPASGPGARMMWFPAKAAFRAGYANTEWDASSTGMYSFAANSATTASGNSSAAFGSSSKATGPSAFVAGNMSTSGGFGSIAMGITNTATGSGAIAVGEANAASGDHAAAIGYGNAAAGHGSVVLGSFAATTSVANGSFVFSDRSGGFAVLANSTPNSFLVRAVGGVTFTVANGATCSIPSGGGQWACSSSRLLKTGFADLDGEDVLTKIRALPVQSWSYTAEAGVRHIGPMAQDFRAAFGLGADDTTIGVLDAAGVSLAGVKALEARTTQLQAENAALRSALEELTVRVAALQGSPSTRP